MQGVLFMLSDFKAKILRNHIYITFSVGFIQKKCICDLLIYLFVVYFINCQ